MYIIAMMKTLVIGALITATSALALPAHACDMHGGGGFGFGNPNANWQAYNPRVSTQDPALWNENTEQASLMTAVPTEKARPSFSNAANRAALLAKARLVKKTKGQDDKAPKTPKEAIIKKASLNADR